MATDLAPMQSGSVASDVTVTDDISVSRASSVLGTTYDVLDDAATVAEAITEGDAEVNGANSITPTVARLAWASRTRIPY